MANSQAICTSFKVELLNGIHAFGTTVVRAGTTADSFKAALYLASDEAKHVTGADILVDGGQFVMGRVTRGR